jgi:hypothetical protein
MEVNGQLHASAALPAGERAPGTHYVGGGVHPTGRCGEEKNLLLLPKIESQFFDRYTD